MKDDNVRTPLQSDNYDIMEEIIELEIELGLHRDSNFQYSDDTRVSETLKSLKYIKKMREKHHMENFNRPLFPKWWLYFFNNGIF